VNVHCGRAALASGWAAFLQLPPPLPPPLLVVLRLKTKGGYCDVVQWRVAHGAYCTSSTQQQGFKRRSPSQSPSHYVVLPVGGWVMGDGGPVGTASSVTRPHAVQQHFKLKCGCQPGSADSPTGRHHAMMESMCCRHVLQAACTWCGTWQCLWSRTQEAQAAPAGDTHPCFMHQKLSKKLPPPGWHCRSLTKPLFWGLGFRVLGWLEVTRWPLVGCHPRGA